MMNFLQNAKARKQGRDLRIIGAISIDLNGVSEEMKLDEVNVLSRAQIARKILDDFCANTSIHGVKYFTDQTKHWVERTWWMIAFVLSVILCSFSVWNIWAKWQDKPVIVSFDDKTTLVGMIPFPAVTICSTKKILNEKIDRLHFMHVIDAITKNQSAYKQIDSEILLRIDALLHVCFKEIADLAKGIVIPRTPSLYETIEDMGPDMYAVILLAMFFNQFARFKPIFTGEGLCYTFNSLNSQDIFTDEIAPELLTVKDNPQPQWDIENGFNRNVNESDVYPHRVFTSGWRDTLNVILGITVDDSNRFCSELAHGFRLAVHTPDELPLLPDDFVHIPISHEVYISIKPSVITTSKGLSGYRPNIRGCYFKAERKLRFFKQYSQQNCEQECLANFTKNECGCLKFSMPRDKYSKVCTMLDISCYNNADGEFSRRMGLKQCNCLPDCTSISYDLEISQAQSAYSDYDPNAEQFMNKTSLEFHSKVFLSYKDQRFISMNRTETSTFSEFMASCGGILGLFMGISMLSGIELFYYFTLRFFCTVKKQKSRRVRRPMLAARRNHVATMNKKYWLHRYHVNKY